MNVLKFTVATKEPYISWAKKYLEPHGFVIVDGASTVSVGMLFPPKLLRYCVGVLGIDAGDCTDNYDAVFYCDADVIIRQPERLRELFVPGTFALEEHPIGEDAYAPFSSFAMNDEQKERCADKTTINSGVWCLSVEDYKALSARVHELYAKKWNGHDQALVNAIMYSDPTPFEWGGYKRELIGNWKNKDGIITHFNGNHDELRRERERENPLMFVGTKETAVADKKEIVIKADDQEIGKITLPCDQCDSTKRAEAAEAKLKRLQETFREVLGG